MRKLWWLIALALGGCDLEGASDEPDGPPPDAAVKADRGVAADAVAPDAAAPDAGPAFPPPDPCGLAAGGDPDADRIVLVGFPYGAEAGVYGTEVGSFVLTAAGELTETGARLDVGGRPTQIAALPSGRFALVLTEGGTLLSVATTAAGLLVVDMITLPNGGWNDLVVDPSGARAHLVRSDGSEQGGIYTVHIECDGVLDDDAQFFPLRLTDALALFPDDPDRAVALGGQAVFEPVDTDDVRLLSYTPGTGWREDAAFDLWADFFDNLGIAISGDGGAVVIPNGSPLSEENGHVIVASLGEEVTEIARLTGLSDARQARFGPDGQTALVSRLEPGRVAVLYDGGDGWEVVDEVTGVGIAKHLAFVAHGAGSGLVLAPSVSPVDGPQIVVLRVAAPGVVERVDTMLLGPGGTRIPDAIGLRP